MRLMQLRMNTQLDAKSQDLIQLPATSAANEVTYSVKFAERRLLVISSPFTVIQCWAFPKNYSMMNLQRTAFLPIMKRNTTRQIKLQPHSKLDQRLTAFL